MKAADLIAELQKLPPDAVVKVWTPAPKESDADGFYPSSWVPVKLVAFSWMYGDVMID